MNNYYILRVNEKEFFTILLPFTLELLEQWDHLTIIFHAKDHKQYPIFSDTQPIIIALDTLKSLLHRTLHTMPDLALKEDIGLVWNKYAHAVAIGGPHETLYDSLDLTQYLLFSMDKTESTWIYKKNHTVMLEITPRYPWHFREPEDPEPPISFDHFLQTYKPYVVTALEHTTVAQWLDQVDTLLNITKRNDSYGVPKTKEFTLESQPPNLCLLHEDRNN